MYKNINIGRIVAFHRKKSKLTRIELSRISGVGKSTIFDLEKGKLTIQLDTLIKIFSVLNINLKLESPLMKEFEKIDSRKEDDEKS